MSDADVLNDNGFAIMFCMIVSNDDIEKAARMSSLNTESGTSFPSSIASFLNSLNILKKVSMLSVS